MVAGLFEERQLLVWTNWLMRVFGSRISMLKFSARQAEQRASTGSVVQPGGFWDRLGCYRPDGSMVPAGSPAAERSPTAADDESPATETRSDGRTEGEAGEDGEEADRET